MCAWLKLLFAGSLVFVFRPVGAAVIGMNKPAEPLTEQRILLLPAAHRGPWLAYLHRSESQMKADRAALAAERQGLLQVPSLPQQGSSGRAVPLHRALEFYRGPEARRIGDIILSFQTPAGGWSKNLAFEAPRARGQSYATANLAPSAAVAGDFDLPRDEQWHYVGTLDNDATNTELHFLAELAAVLPGHEGDAYRAGFLRGVEYLLHAQFPNGGWPQVWPLEGGYHDALTFNDGAIVESTELLNLIAHGERMLPMTNIEATRHVPGPDGKTVTVPNRLEAEEDFRFVPQTVRKRAGDAVARAIKCMLDAQVRLPAAGDKKAVLTVWVQQNDPLTLAPVAARNFEPAALSSGESAEVMTYLMSLSHPSPAAVQAVHAAAAWFEAHKITGYAWSGGRDTPGGRRLSASPNAGPLWARYYSLTTDRPIFGDRDKTIHDNVMDLSLERRNGYAWYGDAPARALEEYRFWKQDHPFPAKGKDTTEVR